MTNLDLGKVNISQVAQEIAVLLDQKDNQKDGFINASIWNKFVASGNQGKTVGNGENGSKSKIKNRISLNQAASSIANYIKNKGVDVINGSLKSMNIDYTISSSESEPSSTSYKRGNKVKVTINGRQTTARMITPEQVMESESNFGTTPTSMNTQDGYFGDSAQRRRGDCYFVATINSIRNTKQGQKALKNNIKYSKDGGCVVTLPGALKIKNHYARKGYKNLAIQGVYYITREALEAACKSNKYSSGDADVVAFELAMEAYRAEYAQTFPNRKNIGIQYAEGQNSSIKPTDDDVLSGGRAWDAAFLLTGERAEDVFACTNNRYNKVKPYKDGQYGYISRETMNRQAMSDYNYKSQSLAVSEIDNFTTDARSLQEFLNKYKGREGDYALSVAVRVATDGPDGKTKAGGSHVLTVVKITNSIIYVSNPWHPEKIEPIPRADFLQMATSFTATRIAA